MGVYRIEIEDGSIPHLTSFLVKSKWRLKESTEMTVTREVRSLFEYLTTRTMKMSTSCANEYIYRVTSYAGSHWRNKEETGVKVKQS